MSAKGREERRVLVLGAGPAGAASALFLARSGFPVLVLEARTGPKSKVCGEGLMPAGVRVLEDLGIAGRVRAMGAIAFRGIRYMTAGGASAAGEFPTFQSGVHGLAMPRLTLDAALREALASEPGVQVLEGWVAGPPEIEDGRVTGVTARERGSGRTRRITAALTIAADGLHSRLHALPGVNATRPARRRFGISVHLEGVANVRDLVEVHLIENGELYLTPQGEGRASLALLAEEVLLAGDPAPDAVLSRALERAPELARRCAGARRTDASRVYGPLGLTVERACGPGWLLAGDAAGALDPITGEGVALALVAARELGRRARMHGAPDAAACRASLAIRRRMERDLQVLTHALLYLSRSPRLKEGAVRLAGAFPGLFSRVLGIAAAGHVL